MARRNPPAKWVLPNIIDPPRICFQIEVPNETYHLAAFRGAILNLAAAYKWQDDPAHTAKRVAAVWDDVYTKIRLCDNKPIQMWIGASEELMIRQDPDNPCLLQSSVDGMNWCTFADLSKCLTPSAQPGGGTTQPEPGGGQACYRARMLGSGTWLLPTALNTGDVVNIQDASGAVSSSYNGNWYCPSGSQFFAGACVGFEQTHGGNPVPSAPDQSLVINISGTYYSLNSGAFTVPSGVSNAQAFIQVNDATLTGKSGELAFDVCVTNNQTEGWSVSQNLALNSGGWIPSTDSTFSSNQSVWVAGQGWKQVTCVTNNSGGATYDVCYVELDFSTPTTLNHIDILYDTTVGDLDDGGGDKIQAYYSGGWHTLVNVASVSGTNKTESWDGSQSVEKLQILLYGAVKSGTSCPTPGTATLKQFNMNGVGAYPL